METANLPKRKTLPFTTSATKPLWVVIWKKKIKTYGVLSAQVLLVPAEQPGVIQLLPTSVPTAICILQKKSAQEHSITSGKLSNLLRMPVTCFHLIILKAPIKKHGV